MRCIKLCAAALLTACGPTFPPLPSQEASCLSGSAAATKTELVVGSGEGAFTVLGSGAHVQMHQGPQGGQHFYLTLHLATVEGGDKRWGFETRFVAEGATPYPGPGAQDFATACAPGWTEVSNVTTFLDSLDIRAGTLYVKATLTASDYSPVLPAMTATISLAVDPPQ